MSKWTSDELTKIGNSEELRIASQRGDGTMRKGVTIWVVRHGDDLYVRSVNGRASAWFRGTHVRHRGRIEAGGVAKDVSFVEEGDPDINNRIDAESRNNYRRYAGPILNSVLTPQARAATIKLVPQAPGVS